MISSPLEQFHLIPILPLKFGSFDFTITHSTLMMYIGLIAFVLLLRMLVMDRGGYLVPNRWQVFVETVYELSMSLVSQNISGGKGIKYFPFVFIVFFFIMVCNVTGMVPYSFTSTSHLSITLGLAMMVFLGYHIICVRKHGIRLLELYYPSGVGLILAPIIIPIEFIARCAQVISLSVRLFANMMAGHTLLKVIASFAWQMMAGGTLLFFAHIVTLGVLTLLVALEMAVAFIQAYVFAVLTCIYLNDAENLH
jgi:ATP synthase subunit 6